MTKPTKNAADADTMYCAAEDVQDIAVRTSGKLLRQKYCESYIEFFDSCADKIAELARIANQRNI